jgi:phosphoribosylaminoimidazole-succinocarboxamide synthase
LTVKEFVPETRHVRLEPATSPLFAIIHVKPPCLHAIRCTPLKMIKVECIARGYLVGLGLREYRNSGAVSGVRLPEGLVEGDTLPEPIFTPRPKSPTPDTTNS